MSLSVIKHLAEISKSKFQVDGQYIYIFYNYVN